MDELKEFEFLFKQLKLKQLYRMEELIKQAIREIESVEEITEMDRAKLRHEALTKQQTAVVL